MIPKPVIPVEPSIPTLVDVPVVVITPQDAQYYQDICNDYESGEYGEGELPLTREAACNWAIYGHTVDGEITFEDMLNRMADYAEQMREHARQLRQIINHLYQAQQRTE